MGSDNGSELADITVRLVYFDEAGIGDVAKEPFAVVAGVIVEGDKQWRAVEAHLRTLVEQYVQPNDQAGFIFHAKDIHHGARKMPRDRYASIDTNRASQGAMSSTLKI